MNLFADESIDRAVVERLRVEGHDVVYVSELSPSIPDDEVLRLANEGVALLVTADKDFGELVFRMDRVHAGVILLRLAGMSIMAKAEIVAEAIHHHRDELSGSFAVISPGIVRIRRFV